MKILKQKTIEQLLIAICFCAVITVPAREARADSYGDVVAGILVVGILDAGLVAGALTTSIGNLYYSANGLTPPKSWRHAGYVMGTLNLLVGGLVTGFLHDTQIGLGIGISQMLVGGTSLGFTIWGHVNESNKPDTYNNNYIQKVTISPMVTPGPRGQVFYGVGVKMVTF